MQKVLVISCLILILGSSISPSLNDPEVQKKVIRQGEFNIECYVSLKGKTAFAPNRTYYWYKSGEIHQARSGSGGLLLHDDYKKYYRSNQLAEMGTFNYGLKHGTWKNWHDSGTLKHIEEWHHGERHGFYMEFDSIGNKLTKGYYKNNLKAGDWIDYIKNDTIPYSKGEVKTIGPNKKEGFFKRLFKKKDGKTKSKDTNKKKENKAKNKADKKDGFFKRLFKKKENKKKS